MKKIIASIALGLVLVLSACSEKNDSVSIEISGSTSVEKFAKGLGEAYREVNKGAKVNVQGGGSSAGVPNVLDGISNIGMLSRNLKDSEKDPSIVEHVVALDGIAVAVHKDNKVANLTIDQLNKIYSGEIKNWNEVGGDDLEIVLVGREAGSGTRDGFESIVGVKDVKAHQEFNETGQVIAATKATKGAIGYISSGHQASADKVLTIDGVAPTLENIQSKAYVLQRDFIMVTKKDAPKEVTDFIDFIFSADGQKVAEITGAIPVK